MDDMASQDYVKHEDIPAVNADTVRGCGDENVLPYEDTLWLIVQSTEESDDGDVIEVLSVRDKMNTVIGSRCMTHTSFITQCRELLNQCMLNPLTGVPRRPVRVTFKDLTRSACDLDLTDIGVSVLYNGTDHSVDISHIQMRNCSVCGFRGSPGLFRKCAACKGMLYCSKSCQVNDWKLDGRMASCSHKNWCSKIGEYMTQTDVLNKLPFTFTAGLYNVIFIIYLETTSANFTEQRYAKFLQRHGVYRQGAWKREVVEIGSNTTYGDLPGDEDPIVLPVESTILDDPIIGSVEDTWESYYKCRGFRLDSPIAILMQWPLTLYYIIKYCLPYHYNSWSERGDKKTLLIDIVGVDKEADLLPVFKELALLLPEYNMDVWMFGSEICRQVNGRMYECNNLKIKLVRGLYHKKSSTARIPSVVVGFNAGLAAYKQWSQTLVKLRTQRIPAYFTDYCEYSCECSRVAVEGLAIGTISSPIINPFRSPVRRLAPENDMPSYSNGFMYHLIYPP